MLGKSYFHLTLFYMGVGGHFCSGDFQIDLRDPRF